jgi:hypothetical protein
MDYLGRPLILSLTLILTVTAPTAVFGADTVARTVPAPAGQFPPGFLFGTGSSPYQVEGGLHATDWYQWETLCPRCSGDKADDGPDFWNRYRGDLVRARVLLNNAIRIGIDWSRVFPTEASFPDAPDLTAVAHYHRIIRLARFLGLKVMVTLQHFDLPIWVQDLTNLTDRRGWEDPAIVQRLATWAGWCAKEFGAEVDWWITINEPVVAASAGWITGDMPPGMSFAVGGAITAVWNMVDAHAAAYDAIKANDTTDADHDGVPAMVSIAHQMRAFYPVNPADPRPWVRPWHPVPLQPLFRMRWSMASKTAISMGASTGRMTGRSIRHRRPPRLHRAQLLWAVARRAAADPGLLSADRDSGAERSRPARVRSAED